MTSTDLEQLDKTYLWHPFTQMQDWLQATPIIMDHGEGNYLYDIHGKKYLDAISSLWVNIHGHGNQQINQAIIDQTTRVCHSTMLGFSSVPGIQLAEKLIQLAPSSLKKVFYSDSGSTSVEIALKIAFQYWQQCPNANPSKTKFISFCNAYHGDTIGSVSVGGMADFHAKYHQMLFDTLTVPYPYCYRCPNGSEHCTNTCIDTLKNMLDQHHHEVAGLIIEPLMQGAAGMIQAPPGFLAQVQALCRQYDVLLIIDEVATGFGRTGKMFACEHENIQPDLMCVAKGLTGGYLPLAATLTSQKVFDAFLGDYKDKKTFFHGHSYTGNQLACAAALANLDLFSRHRLIDKIQPIILFLKQQLLPLNELPHVGNIRQIGLMVGIELVEDKHSRHPFPWEQKIAVTICSDMVKKGFLLRPLGNVIVLMPPLSIHPEEIAGLLSSLHDSILKFTPTKDHKIA